MVVFAALVAVPGLIVFFSLVSDSDMWVNPGVLPVEMRGGG
jgi:hypothetical protein